MGSGGGDGGAVQLQREQLEKQRIANAQEQNRKELLGSQTAATMTNQISKVDAPTQSQQLSLSLSQLMQQKIRENIDSQSGIL